MKPERVVYYTDPLKDDFAGTKISTVRVDASFPYLRRSLPWRVGSFLMYYGVAVPIVWLTAKLYLGLKFENRAALKKVRGSGRLR